MDDATKVGVAVTGGVFKGLTTATAPTGTTGVPTGFVDLGFITEDGVEIALPGPGDSTPIKAWQNGTTVRVIRTTTDDNPTWHFTLMETNLAAVETYFGVTVVSTATEGSLEFTTAANRLYNSYVVDAIDGAELQRDYVPRGIVTDVGAHTLAGTDATTYEVTVEGELDAAKGFNFKRWATRLKTAA